MGGRSDALSRLEAVVELKVLPMGEVRGTQRFSVRDPRTLARPEEAVGGAATQDARNARERGHQGGQIRGRYRSSRRDRHPPGAHRQSRPRALRDKCRCSCATHGCRELAYWEIESIHRRSKVMEIEIEYCVM